MFFLPSEDDFVATSSIRKVLVFPSSAVPMKAARDNQGVQILLSKKGSRLVSIVRLSESGLQDPKYYRTRTLPAVGSYLKAESLPQRQLELGETN